MPRLLLFTKTSKDDFPLGILSRHRVTFCHSFESLVEEMEREPVEGILLHLEGKEDSQGELIFALRDRFKEKLPPVLLVADMNDTGSIRERLHQGVDDFLLLPLSDELLSLRLMQARRHLSRLGQSEDAAERMSRQLREAGGLQMSLQPDEGELKRLRSGYGVSVYLLWKPRNPLGRNYLDIVGHTDGAMGMYLLSFPGEEWAPALMTFRLKDTLAMMVQELSSPSLIMTRIGHYLLRSCRPPTAAFCLVALYQPEQRRLLLANAGMPPPLLRRHQSGEIENIDVDGPPLGTSEGNDYDQAVIRLEPNDKLLLQGRGFVSTTNREGEEFGLKGVQEIARDHFHRSPTQFLQTFVEGVNAHGRNGVIEDLSAFMMRVEEE